MLKWIHSNGVMNLSVIITYSIVDSIINSFSSSLRPFDPKRRVSTIIKKFWFNKEHFMLLILSKRVSLWSEKIEQWRKKVSSCFNMPMAVAKWV